MQRRVSHRTIRLLATGLTLAALLAGCASDEVPNGSSGATDEPTGDASEDVEPTEADEVSFEGETLRLVVAYSAGGGFDTYGRAIARHIGSHLPGEPTVIVENMPGAGGLLMLNTMASRWEGDGTVFGFVLGSLFLQDSLGADQTDFDGRDFNFLGAPAQQRTVCVASGEAGITSLDDLADRAEPAVFGGTAPGDATIDVPTLLGSVAGLNVETVSGYEGTSEIALAIEQGELDAGCWGLESVSATHAEALTSGDFVIFAQSGTEAHPDIPDVSLILDAAPDDQGRELLTAAIEVPAKTVRTLLAPAGVEPARVEALRSALTAVLTDPEFVAEAEELKLQIEPVSGEELTELIASLYDLQPSTMEALQELLLGES